MPKSIYRNISEEDRQKLIKHMKNQIPGISQKQLQQQIEQVTEKIKERLKRCNSWDDQLIVIEIFFEAKSRRIDKNVLYKTLHFFFCFRNSFFAKYDMRQKVNHLKFDDAKLEKEQFSFSKNDIDVIKWRYWKNIGI